MKEARCLVSACTYAISGRVGAFKTHPSHPRVLQHLASTQAVFGIPNKKFGYEVFGTCRDVSPIFLWKLVFRFLDTLKQNVLEMKKRGVSYSDPGGNVSI